ncbi:MAG: DUF1599 domain-containing protein [Lentimicrobiaceae bacterium]|jgi:hypothetical protein|nr:DUF1599 domain-containing protein [Lentimicrobiaceae bacterium]MBT6672874.1 DUF1599 domain-containing protein [Lentimicrobiaceae bacterium]MBT7620797.1 DUF1599 domain-containing protein [Lentimicrobiaceae bacterium]
MSKNTATQFNEVIEYCREIFEVKQKDYGTAWRILRLSSLTDQIYIKANRIRSLQVKDKHMVDEGIIPEFVGIVNYSVMALIQLDLGVAESDDLSPGKANKRYMEKLEESRDLMLSKNHDYDEAWRNMRISSLTDIILMKLLRIKQIEDNQGQTLVSEGLDANYQDIINYSLFALIKLIVEKQDVD